MYTLNCTKMTSQISETFDFKDLLSDNVHYCMMERGNIYSSMKILKKITFTQKLFHLLLEGHQNR